MKRAGLLAVLAVGLLAFAGTASAVPTIDGAIGIGEWTGAFLTGLDPNEAFQGDSWDISAFYIVQETAGGGLGNGLYFRMDTYAAPTFTGEAPFITDESRFEALLDFDGDTTLDRLILFNDTNDGSVNIYDGSLTFLGTGTGALGATTEWFAPAALMPSFPATLSMLAVGKLDNGGLLAEDFIPDSGFLTPVIPEPGSMMLLGLGLMGGVISRRKRAVL